MNYVNAVGKVLKASAPSTSWLGSSKPYPDTVIGTGANENLTGRDGDTVRGGGGDDVYGMAGNAIVVEEANGGIDTVNTWTSYELTANVENLTMNGGWGWFGIGNDLDNIIIGTTGFQQIDGGRGDDVLIGGAGGDMFVVSRGNGSDLIVDFKPGADQIRLGGYGLHTIEDIRAVSVQRGADTVLNFSNGEILVLSNVTATTLTSADFLLDVDMSHLRLTFADEFNGLSLAINGGVWKTSYGYMPSDNIGSRYMHDEAQVYMDPNFAGTGTRPLGVNPFSLNDGVLTITAAPVTAEVAPYLAGHSYTSGLLTTQNTFSQLYGYFEVRTALPAGQGMWPAFWLLPANGGWPPEIDVFEGIGSDPMTIFFGSHETANGQKVSMGDKFHIDTTKFHTYGVDWTPEFLTFYIDGVAVQQQPTPASMNTPMYMLVNLAVGGAWGGAPNATTGTGRMQVDYVRAYANDDTVSARDALIVGQSFDKAKDPIVCYAPDDQAAHSFGAAEASKGPETSPDPDPSTSPLIADDADTSGEGTSSLDTSGLDMFDADDFIWVGDIAPVVVADDVLWHGQGSDFAPILDAAGMMGFDPALDIAPWIHKLDMPFETFTPDGRHADWF